MGHIFTEIELSNPREQQLASIKVSALADTGALMLCIPEHVALQLKLSTESLREVSMADGRNMNVPYVGPIKVTFGDRFCYVGALVLGDEVLLGAVPMEDMDLVVDPYRREITVDPASPNIPRARVKSQLPVTRRGRLVAVSESKVFTGEQEAARERVSERMKRGYHLGGKRLQREEIYERRTDYN